MEQYEINKDPNEQSKRPELLSVLCILTFIGSGLVVISNLYLLTSLSSVRELAASGDLLFPGMDKLLSVDKAYFLIGFILSSISLFGAYNMWKLKKIGFHLYTIAQILLLIVPYFYFTNIGFPYFGFLISASFVILYGKNLKYMS
ncbi:MAG: hypothetical protein K8R41_04515 [Bacteroidales bacterium]|nr:hypothetical protein [Bacteroidales bacterium]